MRKCYHKSKSKPRVFFENYISENADAQIKAMQNLRKEYDMDIIDSDIHDQYVKYIQNSLAQIQANKNSNKNSSK